MSKAPIDQTIDTLPGEERGMPSVNQTGPSTAKRGLVVLFLLLVLGLAAAAGYWKFRKNAAKADDPAAQKSLQLSSAVPVRTFSEPPPAPPEVKPDAPALPASLAVPAPALPGPAANMQVGTVPAPAPAPAPVLDKSSSGLMVSTAEKAGSDSTTLAGSPAVQSNGRGLDGSNGGGGMASLLTATTTSARKAGMLGNRNLMLPKGRFIDCVLETKLDSTVPGMTSCVVTRDIFSDNGKVLLIEKGSTASGEYSNSNLKQGMARIFVLWTRIKTPNGVVIPLDSPGTDQLGGSGLPGYIDDHFWKRFGGALMLSLVDDVAAGLTSKGSGSGNGNQFNFGNTADATQSMAAEVLKNTINIPPTLYKNQGERIGIYVARDLDFSGVYDVTAQ